MQARRGAIAICRNGHVGLITSDHRMRKAQSMGQGLRGCRIIHVWQGVHLDLDDAGRPWESQRPKVIGYVSDLKLGPLFLAEAAAAARTKFSDTPITEASHGPR